MLEQVVYVSSSQGMLPPGELRDILKVSRRNNARDEITGLLLYEDGNFFQLLEGEHDKVEACFERIGGDPRHSGVIVILREEIKRRSFDDWSMGYVRPQDLDGQDLEGVRTLTEQARRASSAEAEPGSHAATLARTFLERCGALASARDCTP